jgi:hypothetical protein
MLEGYTNNEMLFRKWQQLKVSKTQVMEELIQHRLSAEDIAAIWDKYCKYCIDRRSTQGWTWMGIGGFMGLLSCVLTMIDPMPDLRWLFMYGFTTAAVSIALYGCYLVMEKPDGEEG